MHTALTNAIEAALSAAPRLPLDITPQVSATLKQDLVDIADDDPDAIYTFTSGEQTANEVVVTDLATFRQLIGHTLLWPSTQPDDYVLDAVVRHESQHELAGSKLNALGTGFGIAIRNSNEQYVDFTPFYRFDSVKTTRLGVAAILAHPLIPSPQDRADIRALGFFGVNDVARQTLEYNVKVLNRTYPWGEDNEPTDHFLPVPLGVNTLHLNFARKQQY